MAVKSLFIMWGGQLTSIEKGSLVTGVHGGAKLVAPILMALVLCDEGNLVFDTGLHSGGIEDPFGTWGEKVKLYSPKMQREDDVQNRLNEIGFRTEKIDYVVNSHLHWDHSGGNRLFTSSKILIQKSEYRFACFPDSYAKASFPRNHFDHPGLRYELVEGDFKIYDGVHVIFTSGHTPGHQSLLIRLKENGTIILPGDAIPMRENLEKNLLPGVCLDANAAFYSILKLKDIAARENGQIFPFHDTEFVEGLKKSPSFYE